MISLFLMVSNVTVVQLEIKKIRAFFDFNDGECKSKEIGEFMTLQLALLSRIKFCLHIAIWPGFACDELGTPIAASSIRFHTSILECSHSASLGCRPLCRPRRGVNTCGSNRVESAHIASVFPLLLI